MTHEAYICISMSLLLKIAPLVMHHIHHGRGNTRVACNYPPGVRSPENWPSDNIWTISIPPFPPPLPSHHAWLAARAVWKLHALSSDFFVTLSFAEQLNQCTGTQVKWEWEKVSRYLIRKHTLEAEFSHSFTRGIKYVLVELFKPESRDVGHSPLQPKRQLVPDGGSQKSGSSNCDLAKGNW